MYLLFVYIYLDWLFLENGINENIKYKNYKKYQYY